MAYGLRLRIEYNDIKDVLTRINIYQDGYSGSADVRYAHAGFRAEWGDQGSEAMPLVYGSSCTIFFDSEFDYEYLYLFSADARKHLVEIEKGGNMFWRGYIEPDSWTEPLIATPYPVQCTAYDGLGFLKDIDFTDDAGDDYTGRKTMFEILKICLLKTGLDLTVNTAINWQETGQAESTNILKVHKVDCDIYLGLSCYEVIEKLLPECRVFQRKGEWWILANTIGHSTFSFYKDTAGGSSSVDSVDPVATGFWFEGESAMEILPAVKKLSVKQDFGYVSNLINNGSFADYIYSDNPSPLTGSLELTGWTRNNVNILARQLNADGDKFIIIEGRVNHDVNYVSNQYIINSIDVKATDGAVKFNVKYALVGGEGSSGNVFMRIKLITATKTYFLQPEFGSVDNVLSLVWVEDMGGAYKPIVHYKFHAAKDPAGLYYPAIDKVNAWPSWKIPDHFETFSDSVLGIPEDGSIEIYLYGAMSSDTNVVGVAYDSFSTSLLDDNNDSYPTNQTLEATVSTRNNFIPEDVSLLIGDFPDNPNKLILFKGGITRSDNTATVGWKVVGDTTVYAFADFIARIAASSRRTPRQSYNARIADIMPGTNFIVIDPNNAGKYFIECGLSYDDRYQAIDGRWIEMLPVDLTQASVVTSVDYQEKSTDGAKSTPTKPDSIDHRVNVISDEGVLVSSPGFMADDDFVAIQGLDGFVRIYLRAMQSGIITGLVSASVQHEFDFPFDTPPVGRGSLHVYRTVQPEAGLILDQNVLWHSFAFTTNADGLVDGFELTIDASESLSGIVIEYCFTKNMNI
jgi:hypothetical protein